MYRSAADPWAFETAPYERGRFAHIQSFLANETFEEAFEPGCSEGVLTELLAPSCSRLLAIDPAPTAVARAAARCAHLPNVDVRRGMLPDDIPSREFDLVVFSELGYYFSEKELRDVVDRLVGRTRAGGLWVSCHWTGTSPDHILTGQRVTEIVCAHEVLAARALEQRPGYILATLHRR